MTDFGTKSETVPLVFREYGKKRGDPWTHPQWIRTTGERSVGFPCGILYRTSSDRKVKMEMTDRSTTQTELQINRGCLLSHGLHLQGGEPKPR